MRAVPLENVDMLPSHGVTQTTRGRKHMSTSLLYHAFGLHGYTYRSQHFEGGCIFFCIDQPRDRLRCSQCASENVWVRGRTERIFRTLPIGGKPTSVVFNVPRLGCLHCDAN